MALIYAVLILVTLIGMPFATRGQSWSIKLFYIALCGLLTPFIGIPLFIHLFR